jgi:aspartate kinase
MIVPEREELGNPVVGIACAKGFCSIDVSKYMMNREIGFGRKVLQILEDENLSYEHTPSGIDNISFVLSEKQLSRESETRVLQRITDELHVDAVSIKKNRALIMLVGEGMLNSLGITARATSALAGSRINIEMINQGSSEVSIMFGVKSEDGDKAVQALYEEFFGNQ